LYSFISYNIEFEKESIDAAYTEQDLESKARHIPLEGYSIELHIACRSFRGTEPEDIHIHTVHNMPLSPEH